jgi:hypothetical protein
MLQTLDESQATRLSLMRQDYIKVKGPLTSAFLRFYLLSGIFAGYLINALHECA